MENMQLIPSECLFLSMRSSLHWAAHEKTQRMQNDETTHMHLRVCPFDIAAVKTHSHAALHWAACEKQDLKELNSLSLTHTQTHMIRHFRAILLHFLSVYWPVCLSVCLSVVQWRLSVSGYCLSEWPAARQPSLCPPPLYIAPHGSGWRTAHWEDGGLLEGSAGM